MCGVGYPHIIGELKIGFPVVDIKSEFHCAIQVRRYGYCQDLDFQSWKTNHARGSTGFA